MDAGRLEGRDVWMDSDFTVVGPAVAACAIAEFSWLPLASMSGVENGKVLSIALVVRAGSGLNHGKLFRVLPGVYVFVISMPSASSVCVRH